MATPSKVYTFGKRKFDILNRIIADYLAGRLTRKGGGSEESNISNSSAGALRLGRTVDVIEEGAYGKIIRLSGKPGKEKTAGGEFDAFNRFGQIGQGKIVVYASINGEKQIIQAVC